MMWVATALILWGLYTKTEMYVNTQRSKRMENIRKELKQMAEDVELIEKELKSLAEPVFIEKNYIETIIENYDLYTKELIIASVLVILLIVYLKK